MTGLAVMGQPSILSRPACMCTMKGVVATELTLALHPDRLLPVESGERAIARRLYDAVRDLPVISPHATSIRGCCSTTSRSRTRLACSSRPITT